MDFLFRAMNTEADYCPFDEKAIQRCPFLRNICKPTSFSFSSMNVSVSATGCKGPIFEDGPGFDMAFKLFHGKDGVVPLSERSSIQNANVKSEPMQSFNPLAAQTATVSLSAFCAGGPFNFNNFHDKWKKQKKVELRHEKNPSDQKINPSKHEALGNEWLETGNCPIAKSYQAVNRILPFIATTFQLPPGMKLRCPPAVIAARAALTRTAFVKNLRPQPLPAKMLVIAALAMAVNVPLGMWKEHTIKFSLAWFAAVHAAVPFIAMLRKSVVMPKSAMVLTIAASILGQVIGSRAERVRLRSVALRGPLTVEIASNYSDSGDNSNQFGATAGGRCGAEGMRHNSDPVKDGGPTSATVCF